MIMFEHYKKQHENSKLLYLGRDAVLSGTHHRKYLKYNSQGPISSWETNRSSASQEILRILWNPKVEIFALLRCYSKFTISYWRFGTTYRSRSALTASVAHPVCYSIDKTGSFPRNKVAGLKLISHVVLTLKLKMRGVIPPHHHNFARAHRVK
jgi:hypothetical protein